MVKRVAAGVLGVAAFLWWVWSAWVRDVFGPSDVMNALIIAGAAVGALVVWYRRREAEAPLTWGDLAGSSAVGGFLVGLLLISLALLGLRGDLFVMQGVFLFGSSDWLDNLLAVFFPFLLGGFLGLCLAGINYGVRGPLPDRETGPEVSARE